MGRGGAGRRGQRVHACRVGGRGLQVVCGLHMCVQARMYVHCGAPRWGRGPRRRGGGARGGRRAAAGQVYELFAVRSLPPSPHPHATITAHMASSIHTSTCASLAPFRPRAESHTHAHGGDCGAARGCRPVRPSTAAAGLQLTHRCVSQRCGARPEGETLRPGREGGRGAAGRGEARGGGGKGGGAAEAVMRGVRVVGSAGRRLQDGHGARAADQPRGLPPPPPAQPVAPRLPAPVGARGPWPCVHARASDAAPACQPPCPGVLTLMPPRRPTIIAPE